MIRFKYVLDNLLLQAKCCNGNLIYESHSVKFPINYFRSIFAGGFKNAAKNKRNLNKRNLNKR